ncbi:MAG: BrnA antitoxin family protein [Holosporales bacterium]
MTMNELSSMPDEKIDFSDIPPLDKEFWENAIVHHPHGTQPITLRVKKSVLNYFKASGVKGYQRRINAVLESYVQAQKPL